MNKKLTSILVVLLAGFVVIAAVIYVSAFGFKAPDAVSHAKKEEPKPQKWQFAGPTGTFDRQSAQRGYKVYKEVCSSCHSMNLISFRNLKTLGFSDGEIKSIAAGYSYPNIGEDGTVGERKGIPSDHFKNPFDSKEAAAAANGGAVPPDLSLMIKAREDGPDYVYSLLNGYNGKPPADLAIPAGKYFNPYYPGEVISMPQPLHDGQVDYEDGTKATVPQMAHDVVNFLEWTAEPEMELRKRMGIKVVAFLAVFTVFFYIAKVRIWKKVH